MSGQDQGPGGYPGHDDENLQLREIEEGGDSQEKPEAGPQVSQRYAMGLSVDPGTGLPRVTSLGRGLMAAKMARLARQAGVPVEEDPQLVERMFKPVTNRAIPARTYRLIAGILTFIYQVNEARTNRQAEAALEEMKGGPTEGDTDGEDPEQSPQQDDYQETGDEQETP